MKTIYYRNKGFRILAALGGTLVVLFQGRPFNLHEALIKPKFYSAFAVSFSVALLIVYLIHYITLRLDQSHPWNEDFTERCMYQAGLAIVVPLTIDFSVFAIYHGIYHENIFLNRFFPQDFLCLFFLLVFLNTYYMLHARFHFRQAQIKAKRDASLKREPEVYAPDELLVPNQPEFTEPEVLHIRYKKMHVYLMPEDIHCLYRSGNNVRVLTADKNNYACSESLSSLESRFWDKGLYRINREVIINQEIVKGYQPGLLRDTLQIIIKQEYGHIMRVLIFDQLTVTKDHLQRIKATFIVLSRIGKNMPGE